jgi:hypothetical protein
LAKAAGTAVVKPKPSAPAVKQPAAAAVSGVPTQPYPQATQQLSYSGTPRYLDLTLPDEYVLDLREPVRRMEIFDEMRSSDEAVNTAISSREQLIGASNWGLSVAGDTPQQTEILQFVEDNVYPVLPELLRHLAGALQYGFGTVEKVFEWADKPYAKNIIRGKVRRATNQNSGRKIYLRKVAHMRQRTIHSFIVPVQGDLEFLRQYVWTGSGFMKTDVPAEKCLTWTYNRRGDDYWGVPPLRNCYRGWKFKQQLEKLNLLGFDRFGVGTPIAEEGEGWSQLERDRLAAFLSAWRAGQNSFLMHPKGGKITIAGSDGKTVISVLDWVKFYNLAIAKTYLTQLSELGSTETGSRAVGSTFQDQLSSVVQSDCEDIANMINEQLIVQLVDWNFGPQAEYPIFTPSAQLKISTELAQTITALGKSGLVHFDAADEQWLRDGMGMHEIAVKGIDEQQRLEDEAALAAGRALIERARKRTGGAIPGGTPDSGQGDPGAATNQLRRRALSAAFQDPTQAPPLPFRTLQYTEWESKILRPEILSQNLDLEAVRLTAEVQAVLRDIDKELASEAAAMAAEGPAVIAANVRNIAVSGSLKRKLRSAMMKAALRTRSYGYDSVHAEVARQASPDTVGPTRTPRSGLRRLAAELQGALLAADPTPEELQRNLAISAEVDRAVEDEVARREGSVRSSLLTAIQMAGAMEVGRFASVIKQATQQALESLSPARTNDNVGGVINVAFGAGRSDAMSEIVDSLSAGSGGGGGSGDGTGTGDGVVGHISGPVAKVYSAVMDGGTCDECAKWDGGQFPVDYPEDVTGVQAPNPRCAGGYGRCRCVWILITDSEMQSSIPAAKGPTDYPATNLKRRVAT